MGVSFVDAVVDLVDAGMDLVDVVICLKRELAALGGVGVAWVGVGVVSTGVLRAFEGVLLADGVAYFSLTTFVGVTGLPYHLLVMLVYLQSHETYPSLSRPLRKIRRTI